MGKDLMTRPYGRFYYLAKYLSESGHDVCMFLFSYKKNENETVVIDQLMMRSISIYPDYVFGRSNLREYLIQINPDWLIACSDTYFGILAAYYSSVTNSKVMIDAYDNYESYLPYAKPVHWLWHRAIKKCDLLTVAGPSLAKLMGKYRDNNNIHIFQMAADPQIQKADQLESRRKLGLPLEPKLIGYHGSITSSRGINTLFSIIESINVDSIKFVLCGKTEKGISIPKQASYLGYLPDDDVNNFINSMDMLLVINKQSAFGNYSHPVKLYEAMSCNKPVIASRTDSTNWILADYPELLLDTDDIQQFSKRILELINLGEKEYTALPSWKRLVTAVESKLIENL